MAAFLDGVNFDEVDFDEVQDPVQAPLLLPAALAEMTAAAH